MILVGPSLGSAVAIDFAVNYPEAVCAIQQFNFWILTHFDDFYIKRQFYQVILLWYSNLLKFIFLGGKACFDWC